MEAVGRGYLPFRVTVRRSCATWAAPANSIRAGTSVTFALGVHRDLAEDGAGAVRERRGQVR